MQNFPCLKLGHVAMSNFDLPPVDDGISLGDLFQNGNRKRKLAKPVKGVKSKKEDVTVPLSGMAPSSSSSRLGPPQLQIYLLMMMERLTSSTVVL